jgi:hypothetical protein
MLTINQNRNETVRGIAPDLLDQEQMRAMKHESDSVY